MKYVFNELKSLGAMIDKSGVNKYCSENFSLIENYDKAINDDTQTWDCHHRLEELGFTADELKYLGLYWKVPADELIFLPHKEHVLLHKLGKPNINATNHPNTSKKVLQYTLEGDFIAEWPSTREIERQLNINHIHIVLCCNNNKRKTAGGFIWKYKE